MRKLFETLFLTSFVLTVLTAQLSGTKTIGSSGDYTDLSGAFAAINGSGVSGTLTLSVLEDFTEPGTTSLTRSDLSAVNNVVIKPAASTNPVITVSSVNGISLNGSGHVTIDGSNSGGTSRNLSIVRSGVAAASSCLTVQGTCSNITVKNCVIGGATNIPDYALRFDGTSISAVTIENNEIHGRGEANGIIYFNNVAGTTGIKDNVISGDTVAATQAFGVNLVNCGGTITISGNSLYNLRTSGSHLIGIREHVTSSASLKIHNNFLGGNFVGPSVSNTYAILSFAGSSLSREVYHNTVVLNSIGGSPFTAACVFLDGGAANVRNNLLINDFNNSSSACIYEETGFDPNDLTSNYNDLYKSGANGKIGIIIPGIEAAMLANWQSNSTGEDANSVSTSVLFVSSTADFHVAGASNGDTQLTGTPIAGVTTDIDGDTRSGTFPYMGADEGSVALPVQMTGLFATVRGLQVELSWTTQSEVDNFGFEVERRMVQGSGFKVQGSQPETLNLKLETNWSKVGFVSGSGTSTGPRTYSYRESLPGPGRFAYRLRQIDRNGAAQYTEGVEIEAAIPHSISLRSYPNPFNPATVIRFTVTEPGRTRLSAFNMLGEQIAVLFDEEVAAANQFEIPFDASSLPSGMYVVRLEARGELRSMKILLTR